MVDCCFIVNHLSFNILCVCVLHEIQMKISKLQLGVRAKAMILVSCLDPRDTIAKAYPNYIKSDKVEGLDVASEGPKLICHEEKVMVVFHVGFAPSC